MTVETPPIAGLSPFLREAYAMALDAHHGSRRRGDTDIDHPVSVAEVLRDYAIDDEEVLAAALLHDVLEDTDTDAEEVEARFGARVRSLVEAMTEDPAIEPYVERKAEHRHRVARDASVSAIYAADKLARTRALQGATVELTPERLEHYLETLDLLRDAHPGLPMLPELREELAVLRARVR